MKYGSKNTVQLQNAEQQRKTIFVVIVNNDEYPNW